MKKTLFLLFATLLFAQELTFINPFENNSTQTNQTVNENNITETNSTFITKENNITETNSTLNSKENNISTQEITLEANFVTLQPKIKVAVLIDKKKFFKYIPSIINSVNSYFLNKSIDYNIKVFPIDTNISQISSQGYKDILVYSLDKDYIKNLKDYNDTFYVPVFNKNDVETNTTNIYFGGIDYKQQISKFINYMDTNTAVAINSDTYLSQKLFKIESEYNISLIPYTFPRIYYKDLNQNYVFLNIDAGKSAQVLSNITAKNIETKLVFASQIDYNPLLIEITQPQDVQKLLISNSILTVPNEIEDTNLNLNSDIKYNWLNYSTNILLNKIYNKYTQNDEFYMNDFNIYIFSNQINYHTKLYQILNGAFTPIE
ncbi:hypothetical protein [Caminibacter sp.]